MGKQIHPADQRNAEIIASAERFAVSLFIGRGAYDKHSAETIAEAIKTAEAMKAAHPTVACQPLIYAIQGEAFALITMKEAYAMTSKTKTAEKPAAERGTYGSRFAVKRAAERMYPDGAYEIIKIGDRFDFRATHQSEPEGSNPTEAEAEAAERDAAFHCAPPMAETIPATLDVPAFLKADYDAEPVITAEAAAQTRAQIEAEAAPEAISINELAASGHPIAQANAASWPTPKTGKRAAIVEAAKAGTLPTAPDFSANTHKAYRKHLAAMVELATAGDIDGMRAYPTKDYDRLNPGCPGTSCAPVERRIPFASRIVLDSLSRKSWPKVRPRFERPVAAGPKSSR